VKRKQSAKQFVKAIEKAIDASPKHNRCDQCEALVINGVYCHETGCPNSRKTWIADRGEWVLFLECFHCGCDVEEGTYCGCCPETGGEFEEDTDVDQDGE
jgi:hypothetical protein